MLPPSVELVTCQLPGREDRLSELPPSSLHDVVAAVADSLSDQLARYSLFGHSFGALVAFEVAREMMRRSRSGPDVMFVSGRQAPRCPSVDPPIADLPDDQFLTALAERYEGLPQEILRDPALLEIFLPALRADHVLDEQYCYRPARLLACPIVGFAGDADSSATPQHLDAWSAETEGQFHRYTIPGGHFFTKTSPEAVLESAIEWLDTTYACHDMGVASGPAGARVRFQVE